MAQVIDLTGREFGQLTVISRYTGEIPLELSKRKLPGAMWLCECTCGNFKVKTAHDLLHGGDETCGCYRTQLRERSTHWRGYGEISGEYWGRVRSNAAKRQLEFSITIEQAWHIFIGQDRKCVLSGLPIVFAAHRRVVGSTTASIDRIDSMGGYVPGNIQWVHKDINRLKDHFSDAYLIELCTLVHNHSLKRLETRVLNDVQFPLAKMRQCLEIAAPFVALDGGEK